MTATNVLPFTVIPRKPADRCGQLYRCTRCGEEAKIPVMFVLPAVTCEAIVPDHKYLKCGAEMRPVEK